MNYYEILGVNKDVSLGDLKQAYRKLALKYHPDKNPNEDTKHQFQKINEAYSTLSNEDKRNEYDSKTKQPQSHKFYRHFQPDDEFEIFAQSLRKQFNQRKNTPKPKNQTPKPQNQSEHVFRLLGKLILLIALVILASSNLSFTKIPLYQFHKSPEYSNQRTSKLIQVKYFVGDKFRKEIITDEKLNKFDFEVEKTYVNRLKKQCVNVNRKHQTYLIMMQRANHSHEKTNLQKIIDSLDWNSCDQITEFRYIFEQFDKVF